MAGRHGVAAIIVACVLVQACATGLNSTNTDPVRAVRLSSGELFVLSNTTDGAGLVARPVPSAQVAWSVGINPWDAARVSGRALDGVARSLPLEDQFSPFQHQKLIHSAIALGSHTSLSFDVPTYSGCVRVMWIAVVRLCSQRAVLVEPCSGFTTVSAWVWVWRQALEPQVLLWTRWVGGGWGVKGRLSALANTRLSQLVAAAISRKAH